MTGARPPAAAGPRRERRRSPAFCSLWRCTRPSVSITRQNGQPGDDRLGLGRQGLVHALQVDALADLLLHPHPRAAGAAAQGPVRVAGHLGQRGARSRPTSSRGGVVDLVVPSQVARVVVGDLLRRTVGRLDRRQLAARAPAGSAAGCGGRPRSCPSSSRVLAAECVQAVRTGVTILRGRGSRSSKVSLSVSAVCLGHHLEQELVARAAGRVAGAGLLGCRARRSSRRRCAAARRWPARSCGPGRRTRPAQPTQ